MKKLTIIWIAIFAVFVLFNTTNVFAIAETANCTVGNTQPSGFCDPGLDCIAKDPLKPLDGGSCQKTGNITIKAPTDAANKPIGYSDLGKFINNIITLVFILAIIIVLFMLIWGALEWITSGGEKEAVAGARNRIISALIGLAVLSVAFALANVAGQFLGFDILSTIKIPRP